MKKSNNDYRHLFASIKGITQRYKELESYTGDNFNVFKILKMEASEVKMHSAMLAELLNPQGSHGQKNKFLDLFIEGMCFKGVLFDTANCNVRIEKHTGYLNTDKSSGGRIDIFIYDRFGNHIIIENKIFAGDQDKQLIRYNNYSGNADLLYLTLDGHEPSNQSRGELVSGKDYKCISYRSDILLWLEKCRKEAVALPILRESISQYINLIKYLTNQTFNDAMKEDLIETIKANIQSSIIIADNLKATQAQILQEFKEALQRESSKRNLTLNFEIDFRKRFNGFYLAKDSWKELRIGFQFQEYDRDLVFGIHTNQNKLLVPISESIRSLVEGYLNNQEKGNPWWPWLQRMDHKFLNWHSHEVWLALVDGEMLSNVLNKIDILLLHIGDSKL